MEPERHIEKLLQAMAKKRREQAGEPFELHPVAREELLREASRRAAKKSGGGFFAQLFSGFGPRLALAFSTVVMVAFGIWLARPLFIKKPEASTLAMASLGADRPAMKNEPLPGSAPVTESAATPVVAAEPAREVRTEIAAAASRANSAEESFKTKAPIATQPSDVNSAPSKKEEANRKPAPGMQSPKPVGVAQASVALHDLSKTTVAPPSPSAPAATHQNTRAVDSFAANKTADKVSGSTATLFATNAVTPVMTVAAADREAQKQVKTAPAPGSVNTGQSAKFDSTANNPINGKLTPVSQNFNRVVAPTIQQRGFGGAGAATPLLASFKMEQNGQEIRVVDADGSVYTGSWQVAPEQNAVPAAPQTGGFNFSGTMPAARSTRPASAPAANNNLQAMQNYFFSVSGTNRNLKQRITFSGNFIPLTNVSNAANNEVAVGGLADGRSAVTLNVTPPVLLNSRIAGKAIIGAREIEVNANPAP